MNENIKQHVGKLGYKCKDTVTGFRGVIISVSFDVAGGVQMLLAPKTPQNKENQEEPNSNYWFPPNRLIITSKNPVIEVPSFRM